MRDDVKAAREAGIEAAAYVVLAEKGFAGASMLAIAKRAKASNETLYRWYGDKTGLFRHLIAKNADVVSALLRDALETGQPPAETLKALGPVLLQLLVSDKAIALNRAAAADASGVLGQALTQAGRESVAPLIADVIKQAAEAGLVTSHGADTVSLYIDLLVGDLQIRRAIGALPALSDEACRIRADQAVARFFQLMTPE